MSELRLRWRTGWLARALMAQHEEAIDDRVEEKIWEKEECEYIQGTRIWTRRGEGAGAMG